MTRYNSANVKSCNPQLNKVKSEINNGTEVTLNLLPKVIGWSKMKLIYEHKLLFSPSN